MQSLVTKYGTLVPQHTAEELRKRDIFPVEYHANGAPKSVPLETQTVIATPVGDIPAELVSFHGNGEINRVFPLNGKLSGYWSEADELTLAPLLTIRTPAGDITAKFISISFHKGGSLRSLTLCPGETAKVMSPLGPIEMRIGISFTLEGHLESLEPANPSSVQTLAGDVIAYDPDVIGVNGDRNSLGFDETGSVCRFTTVTTQVKVVSNDGRTTTFSPELRESYCSESEREPTPIRIIIENETMTIQRGQQIPTISIPMQDTLFFTVPLIPEFESQTKPTCCI